MNKLELNLLLYLEVRSVDNSGAVDLQRFGEGDWEIAQRWAKSGYIQFGRIAAHDIGKPTTPRDSTHWVILSRKAWSDAHAERVKRAARLWAKRKFRQTAEL